MTTIWILLGVMGLIIVEHGMWELMRVSLFDIVICFVIKFFKGGV